MTKNQGRGVGWTKKAITGRTGTVDQCQQRSSVKGTSEGRPGMWGKRTSRKKANNKGQTVNRMRSERIAQGKEKGGGIQSDY